MDRNCRTNLRVKQWTVVCLVNLPFWWNCGNPKLTNKLQMCCHVARYEIVYTMERKKNKDDILHHWIKLCGTKLLQRGGAKDKDLLPTNFIPALVHFPAEVPALTFFWVRKMLSTLPPSWFGARKTGTVFLVIPNRLPRPRYWMNHQLCGEMPEEGFRAALRASYQIEFSVIVRGIALSWVKMMPWSHGVAPEP